MPPHPKSTGSSHLHSPGKQLPSPSGSSCSPAPAAGIQAVVPWQSWKGQVQLPAQSWAVSAAAGTHSQPGTAAPTGRGCSCCTGAGSKWHLAAGQGVSHLWHLWHHHSPAHKGKMRQAKYPKGHIWPNSQHSF